MKALVRVVLYNRVSDPRGRQEPENQARQMRERVQGNKEWKLVQEYVDQFTGGRGDRPAFQQMFQDARQSKFDLVMFWSLDRFSREGVLETLNHLKTLTDSGVSWLSYTEPYLDSLGPFRDAVLAILACIARQEKIRISERVKAGLDRARASGVKVGGRPKNVDWDAFSRAAKVGFTTAELQRMFGLSKNWVNFKRRELHLQQQVNTDQQDSTSVTLTG